MNINKRLAYLRNSETQVGFHTGNGTTQEVIDLDKANRNNIIVNCNIRKVTLMGVIGGIDEVCFNSDRLFFGGKGQVVLYPAYDNRINAESIIEKYWNNDYEQYISNAKPKSKKKTTATVSKSKDKSDTDKEYQPWKRSIKAS